MPSPKPCSYTVTAIANTADGPVDSSSTTTTVTVAVPVPTLTFCSSSETVGEGESVVLYPDFCCCGADAESDYMLDWGDGTSYETSYGCTASEFDHSYAHGGTDYHVEAFLETSVGVVAAEADITVTGSNPINDPGGYDTGFSLSDATTDGALPATTGDSVQAFVSATMDEYCSTAEETESGGVDFGNCSGYGTFDFNNTDGTNPSSAVDYSYHEDGQYLITMVATDLSEETKFATVDNAVPALADVPEQVAASGQSFSVTENFSNVSSELNPVAFVDWGDGTGPHPATITPSGGGAGTITASTSSAPAPGTYTATITLYPMGPTGTSGTGAPTYAVTQTFTLYSWGVVIDHGESNDLLIASSDGTQNQQDVTLIIPHPAGEAFTVYLSSTDASQNYLFNSSGTKLTPSGSDYPSIEIASGDSTSSITYEDGAIDGNSTAGVDQYTLNSEYDASDSTSTFQSQAAAGCGTVPSTAPTTKPASTISVAIMTNPDSWTNVTNGNRAWLPGEVSNLWAEVSGPVADVAGLTYHWTINGDTLYKYSDDAKTASEIGLKPENAKYFPGVGVGLDYDHVAFFWVHTDFEDTTPDDESVSVAVGGVPSGNLTASTSFSVSEPDATMDIVAQGSVIENTHKDGADWIDLTSAHNEGIQITGGVDVPTGFAAGQWKIVQLVDSVQSTFSTEAYGTAGAWVTHSTGGEFYLDTADPYSRFLDPTRPGKAKKVLDPFATGTLETMSDAPGTRMFQALGAGYTVLSTTRHDLFQTYLMFCPAGGSWVPIESVKWHFDLTATMSNILTEAYTIGGDGGPAADGPTDDFFEPLWTGNVSKI